MGFFSRPKKKFELPTTTIEADIDPIRAALIFKMLNKGKQLRSDTPTKLVFQGEQKGSLGASMIMGEYTSHQLLYTFVLVQAPTGVKVAATAEQLVLGQYGDRSSNRIYGPFLTQWLLELKAECSAPRELLKNQPSQTIQGSEEISQEQAKRPSENQQQYTWQPTAYEAQEYEQSREIHYKQLKPLASSKWIMGILFALAISALALVVGKGVIGNRHSQNEDKSANSPGPAPSTESETTEQPPPADLKRYYAVYKNNNVRYLRSLFNDYLAAGSETINAQNTQSTVNSACDRDGEFAVLNQWDKAYYKSKFVVLAINKGTFGGNTITILFQDKPDKIFDAWIFPCGLRSFGPEDRTEEEMEKIRSDIQQFLADKKHAL